MSPLDRRRFVAVTAAAALTPNLRAFAQTTATAKLTLHNDQPGPIVPEDFIGLSYEIQQLSDPTFFAPSNHGLIAQFRALAPHGVLRLGGNTSDVGWWKPTPDAKQPPLPPNVILRTPPGEQSPMALSYAVTPEAVRNLRGFLDATGWNTLFGINLGTSTPQRAAEEAVFVAKTLGQRLEFFQVGNEPDGFSRRFRDKATWTADRYFDEWLASANAIRASVPGAKFGLPDTAGNPHWSTVIADRIAALPERDRPNVAAVTHHYYFTGPPSNPKATLDNLLKTDPRVSKVAETTREAATKVGAKYRMTEGNSCYRGGKPGFSDVFGAALWTADYALSLASFGYSGINLHGGGGKAVADSLGGTLPGEALMPDPKAPHPRPFYTPVADMDGKYVAEPVYFGLQFVQHFAGATIIPVDFDPGPVNATAYAAKLPNGRSLFAIINKDATQSTEITLPGRGKGTLYRLTAPTLTAHEAHLSNGERTKGGTLNVPAASAILFIID
ncbi:MULTISPECIES: hypothetical protein [Acidobacteriaceae]|uniref:hypothetical protein n=1 Tax=Acidobacteriaceae TaxID=204434 RepID=UPI00131AC124|nr:MULTISPECIES: hypothetical protein [Acidobacteriaceae]MDW5265738.1 hypothetical protein [Edaphobacter sp.]